MMSDEESESCEFPDHPNDPELIKKVITSYKTIAIVGISKKQERDSHMVAAYMQKHGYRIVPVNPTADEILGERCYHSLAEIPFEVDVIDVFRKPSTLPALANDIVGMANKPKAVWFQIGVVNNEASKIVSSAGIEVVQNRCMKVEHIRMTA
ncbi:MAG: CoA-binding protein [Nitrospinota bacterium]|nr:CoA-binding protein [Nitrospinota bacterium]